MKKSRELLIYAVTTFTWFPITGHKSDWLENRNSENTVYSLNKLSTFSSTWN